jgi:hypothetical protein
MVHSVIALNVPEMKSYEPASVPFANTNSFPILKKKRSSQISRIDKQSNITLVLASVPHKN